MANVLMRESKEQATDSPSAAASQAHLRASPSPLMQSPTITTASTTGSAAEPLPYTEDHYQGVLVDEDGLPSDLQLFMTRLLLSLQLWKVEGKRGVWLKVPTSKVCLVAPAVEQAGFRFHHAEPGYVMLTHWLSEELCTLPANASHQVGVGAFVLNQEKDVLVVKERSGRTRGKSFWKMPTGVVNNGEDITDGVVREVLEETGVHVVLDSVLAIRQAHGFAFGKSDLFFLCGCRSAEANPAICPQDNEIAEAKWMPLDEWTKQDMVEARPIYRKMVQCCVGYANGSYAGLMSKKLQTKLLGGRDDLFMWMEQGLADELLKPIAAAAEQRQAVG